MAGQSVSYKSPFNKIYLFLSQLSSILHKTSRHVVMATYKVRRKGGGGRYPFTCKPSQILCQRMTDTIYMFIMLGVNIFLG